VVQVVYSTDTGDGAYNRDDAFMLAPEVTMVSRDDSYEGGKRLTQVFLFIPFSILSNLT
jgi:hypothetical protein